MKLLYATSFAKTSGLANRFQVMAMARAFSKALGADFFFGAGGFEDPKGEIKVINFETSKSYLLAWRVLKFCRKESITHIFCRESRLLFFIHLWNRFIFRVSIKTVYEIHELVGEGFRRKFFEKSLAKNVDLNIFLTKYMAERFKKKYHVSKEKIIVESDAVDMKIFDISVDKNEMRRKYNLPTDKKIIGFFGRFKTMTMDKGITDILKALVSLPEDIVFLAMGGKKGDRAEYQKMAEDLGVLGRVIFVEQFEQHILAQYQKATDILLMPFPWTEHFAYYMSPLKMFEYMAAKRPIITTDLPATREILSENMAVIIPPGNPKKLAQAISDLLDHPEKGAMLVRNAFEKVGHYTWERRIGRIKEKLEKE